MTDQLISFETAKLAKEKGFANEFDWLSQGSLPTQSLLQKWLREVYGIMIHISDNSGFLGKLTFNYGISKVHTQEILGKAGQPWDSGVINEAIFNTYEEALEEGLQNALKSKNN